MEKKLSKTGVHTVYRAADGTRVPSVTTFLGVLGKPALIHWAWQMGCDGKDYRKVRDEAGEIGTLGHFLVMCNLLKIKVKDEQYQTEIVEYSDSVQEKAKLCLHKFTDWKRVHKLEPVVVEEYLVSEKHRFGGTADFYGIVDGVPTLIDFKTSKGIYDDYFAQVAAYEQLLIENGHPVEDVRILRIGRNEDEGFEDFKVVSREKHWEIFLHCQAIYELRKQAKRGF